MSHRIVDGYCFDCQGGGCILELAERNARHIRRVSRRPHPWDEWDVNPNVTVPSDISRPSDERDPESEEPR